MSGKTINNPTAMVEATWWKPRDVVSLSTGPGNHWPMGVMQDQLVARSELALLAVPYVLVMLPFVLVSMTMGNAGIRLGLSSVFWLAIVRHVWTWSGRRRAGEPFGETPSPVARIKVVGATSRLRHFLRPSDAGDEPASFLLYFCVPAGAMWKYFVLVAICVGVGVATSMAWPQPTVSAHAGVLAGALAGILAFGVLWPAYLRVSPGRLDVLRGGWGTSLRCVASVDLRDATIWIDLRRRRIFLKEPGRRLVWFSTDLTGRRCALARAIVAAALTTQAPIPLPDDALVG